MDKLKFSVKHQVATAVSAFAQKRLSSRSLMFHSIYKQNPVTDDIYSLSEKKFLNFVNIIQESGRSVVPFGEEGRTQINDLSITFDDGFLDNLELAAPILTKRNLPFTIFMITDFLNAEKSKYLNRNHLIELKKNKLISIGAHGKSHRPLASLTFQEAVDEMRISKEVLEDLLGEEISTMSFPHGSFNVDLLNAARELGYKKCGTSIPVGNFYSAQNVQINRQCIYSCESNMSFVQKIDGKWDWIN